MPCTRIVPVVVTFVPFRLLEILSRARVCSHSTVMIRHAAHIYRLLIVCDVIAACLCPTQALAPNTYRMRLLNGCNARVLKIQFLK